MLNWQASLPDIYFNTDWTDNPSVDMVSNAPETGMPIRRLRSYNIKHTLSCSVTVEYKKFLVFYDFVMRQLHGGIDHFKFTSFIDGVLYTACLQNDGGKPFTYKRQDKEQYTVNFTIVYIELGGATNA